jgi:FkbM family methyltransferase
MFPVRDILADPPPVIRIADVGAAWTGRPHYAPLLEQGLGQVIGFEPDVDACRRLATIMPAGRFFPYALGNGEARTLYVCQEAVCSSLYEPNTALLDRFQTLGEMGRVLRTEPVLTRRLDTIPEAADLDFLTLDVQGSELAVLQGADATLQGAVVIQVEVEFVELYKEQPLFADVDRFLRQRGFSFHRFSALDGRAFRPTVLGGNRAGQGSQILWADAVYMRDFMHLAGLPPEKLLTLAIILHAVYGSFDTCADVLRQYDTLTVAGLWPRYVQRLTSRAPDGVPHG